MLDFVKDYLPTIDSYMSLEDMVRLVTKLACLDSRDDAEAVAQERTSSSFLFARGRRWIQSSNGYIGFGPDSSLPGKPPAPRGCASYISTSESHTIRR